jgi:hypothetical protein
MTMRKITIGDEEITLDTNILEFGETNLNEFLSKIGGWHAYYSEKLADAIFILGLYEEKAEEMYSKRFRELKTAGAGSDKLAEAAAKSDVDVVEAKQKMLAARLNKDLVNGFLRSIDKAFQAAMNFGYNKRKEMDKLNRDILGDDPNREVSKEDRVQQVADILANDPY